MRAAHLHDWKEAVKQGVITQAEGDQLAAAHEAVAKVIEVDDFAPEALSPIYKKPADVHQFFQELGEHEGGKLMARPVFIIDGSRTPFLKARSGPGPFTPVDLAVQCGRPLLARQPFAPTAFDQVILGCVNVIADEMNPARVAALRLGMGEAMVAFTVQINCGSGMQSIDTGYRYIREGVSDLILAGGSEALSYAPLVWPQQGVRWFAGLAGAKGILGKIAAIAKARPAYFKPVIGLERGLTDPITELNMGQTAEVVGHLFGITRAQSDAYAVESHQAAGQCASAGFSEGRGRDRVRARRKILRSRRRRAAGFHAGETGGTEAGVRAALGPGHRRQFLADHRRRILDHPGFGRRRQKARPDAEGRDRRQPMVGARSLDHGARPGAVGDRTLEAQQIVAWRISRPGN